MTLIKLVSGLTILIDINIRLAADNPGQPVPDVAAILRQHLKRDGQGRPYVDVFILTHPDADHCRGLIRHFHFGSPETYVKDDQKILIQEMWSSAIIFRRASRILTLGDDAQAWATEARRRVKLFREKGLGQTGDRIQIMSEDENGKTDDLQDILVKVGNTVPRFNNQFESGLTARLLGPLPKAETEESEEALAENRSSIIFQFEFKINGITTGHYLMAGDAEVAVWERLWQDYAHTEWLKYDVLLSPHHCSWHSLSHDSLSNLGSDAAVSPDALKALSQAKSGAVIIASSNPIKAETADPPADRAKNEYLKILAPISRQFKCTGEHPNEQNPKPIIIEIGQAGPRLISNLPLFGGTNNILIGRQPLGHG